MPARQSLFSPEASFEACPPIYPFEAEKCCFLIKPFERTSVETFECFRDDILNLSLAQG